MMACSFRSTDPNRLRARFCSPADLIHRLFVCISGVADQLQTNYPSDLRRVLKMVLQPNEVVPVYEVWKRIADSDVNIVNFISICPTPTNFSRA